MPLPSVVAARLKVAYGPYPGPSEALFKMGEEISEMLRQQGVKTEGVLALALSDKPYHFVFFSPALHDAVMNKYKKSIRALGDAIKDATGHPCVLKVKVEGGGHVSQKILSDAKGHNPGCAEKKLITAVQSYNEKIASFAVLAHPAANYTNESSLAHIVIGSATQTYIGPCNSCLLVAKKQPSVFAG